MNNFFLILLAVSTIFISCSSDEDTDTGSDLATLVIGTWQLETIRVEGADCQTIYGTDVPSMYPADEKMYQSHIQ